MQVTSSIIATAFEVSFRQLCGFMHIIDSKFSKHDNEFNSSSDAQEMSITFQL